MRCLKGSSSAGGGEDGCSTADKRTQTGGEGGYSAGVGGHSSVDNGIWQHRRKGV